MRFCEKGCEEINEKHDYKIIKTTRHRLKNLWRVLSFYDSKKLIDLSMMCQGIRGQSPNKWAIVGTETLLANSIFGKQGIPIRLHHLC